MTNKNKTTSIKDNQQKKDLTADFLSREISDKTKVAYARRAQLLVNEFYEEMESGPVVSRNNDFEDGSESELDSDYDSKSKPKKTKAKAKESKDHYLKHLDVEMFVRWLLIKKPSRWTKASWRLIRASVNFYLKMKNVAPAVLVVLMDHGSTSDSKPIKDKSLKGQKKKSIPVGSIDKLLTFLTCNPDRLPKTFRRSRYDYMISLFLRANIFIGLRPSEWGSLSAAKTNGDSVTYRAVNAKQSNGRSNGFCRYIRIDNFDANILLDEALNERDFLLAVDGSWEKVQASMATRLSRVNAIILGDKSVSLYSSRHQFSANMKKYLMSENIPREFASRWLADLMGHASDKTAAEHYGKARSGHGFSDVVIPAGVGFSPDPVNIEIGLDQADASIETCLEAFIKESERKERESSMTSDNGPSETKSSQGPIEPGLMDMEIMNALGGGRNRHEI